MRYEDGDLTIAKEDLEDIFKKLGKGIFSTFEMLAIHQGEVVPAAGISVSKSWNAQFGKIIKKYSIDNPGIINEKIKGVRQSNGSTCSTWEIF